MADFETATTMVDNCAPVLEAVKEHICRAHALCLDINTAVYSFLTGGAEQALRMAGDREQARLFAEAVKGADADFWRAVGKHYRGQWQESLHYPFLVAIKRRFPGTVKAWGLECPSHGQTVIAVLSETARPDARMSWAGSTVLVRFVSEQPADSGDFGPALELV